MGVRTTDCHLPIHQNHLQILGLEETHELSHLSLHFRGRRLDLIDDLLVSQALKSVLRGSVFIETIE